MGIFFQNESRAYVLKDFNLVLLTVHVQLDGGGYGYGNIVVRGLASQDGMEVISLQVFQNEFILSFERDLIAIGGVQKCMIPPPGHFRLRVTSKAHATQPHRVPYVIRA